MGLICVVVRFAARLDCGLYWWVVVCLLLIVLVRRRYTSIVVSLLLIWLFVVYTGGCLSL